MQSLNTSQKWLIGSFVVALLGLANTFFLSGDAQTFVYIGLAMAFALFAIFMSNADERGKPKNDA